MLRIINSMNFKTWEIVGPMLGLFGGVIGWIKFHLLGLPIDSILYDLIHYVWSLLWAGIVAAFGRLCSKLVEDKWEKIKSIFKRKNKN